MKTENELIAEFMGAKITKGEFAGQPQTTFVFPKKIGVHYWVEYETSWDWLMPVVEKINNISFTDKRSIELIDTIHKYVSMVQILDAHMYVVEFIKWYNENKKSE